MQFARLSQTALRWYLKVSTKSRNGEFEFLESLNQPQIEIKYEA